ncbi:hypothetical protein SDC9_87776 [bioreactor metagenome]|uniref:Uncharacterized protein n=1 Tax=bioreactor metagenome TaxID=1076179 RepID=A0A644ZJS0_9ZZZZ
MVEVILTAFILFPLPSVIRIQESIVTPAGVIAKYILQSHFYAVFVGKRIHVIDLSSVLFTSGIVDALHAIALRVKIIDNLTVFTFVLTVVGVPLKTVGNSK